MSGKNRAYSLRCLFLAILIGSGSAIYAQLLISEIDYSPLFNGIEKPEYEFIELYNSGNSTIDLSNCYFSSGINLTFPANTQLRSREYLVLVRSTLVHDMNSMDAIEWTSGGLSNAGETIEIRKPSGTILTHVNYKDASPWPLQPTIHHFTIELAEMSGDDSNPSNWFISHQYGGTPGRKNGYEGIQHVMINEFMPSNQFFKPDEYGVYSDWIELFNAGNKPQNIAGLLFSREANYTDAFQIPFTDFDQTIIMPNDYLVLWADGKPNRGILHLGIKLLGWANQASFSMLQPESGGMKLVEKITYPKVESDLSYGRYPNGSNTFEEFLEPTPGAINSRPYIEHITGIFINEIVSYHNDSNTDENGNPCDWIELYNSKDIPVDVGGLYITDIITIPKKYQIPSHAPNQTTIPPKGYLVLYADHKPERGVLHLDLELSSNGEAIGLVHDTKKGEIFVDLWEFDEQYKGVAYGRYPDGTDNLDFLSNPTPGSENIRKFDIIQGLYINEFMAADQTILLDENGNYSDWIEVYNATNEAIDMGGLYWSDFPEDPYKYMLPVDQPNKTTIQAKGFKVFWANHLPVNNPLYLDFHLASQKESIMLSQSLAGQPKIIDSVNYGKQTRNQSYGRYSDGMNNWIFMSKPTPGASNVNTGGTGSTDDGSQHDVAYQEVAAGIAAKVYPNPYHDQIRFVLNLQHSFNRIYVSVRDILGRVIWTYPKNGSGISVGLHEFSQIPGLDQLPVGRYYFCMYADDVKFALPFIKTRRISQ